MLNKGPFISEGIDALDTVLKRMADHQHKKTPELRQLRSWPARVKLPDASTAPPASRP
jgi:pyruvate kinase